jgi:hypothetical protein
MVGIDVGEAIRRLEATPADAEDLPHVLTTYCGTRTTTTSTRPPISSA